MKKTLSLAAFILCAAMLLAVTGFAADSPDAYSIYKRASKNLDAATSYEMAGTIRTAMTMEDTETVVLQNSRVEMLKVSDSDLQMSMHNVVQLLGEDSSGPEAIDVYYKDGYMYTNASGETAKAKLDVMAAAAQAEALDTGLAEKAFKDATVKQTDEGTRISFKVGLDDLTAGGSSSIKDMLGELAGETDIEISDIGYSLLIGNDNKIKRYDMNFDMNMTIEGTRIYTKTKASYGIISIDRVKKINFPDGLAAY